MIEVVEYPSTMGIAATSPPFALTDSDPGADDRRLPVSPTAESGRSHAPANQTAGTAVFRLHVSAAGDFHQWHHCIALVANDTTRVLSPGVGQLPVLHRGTA